MRPMYNSSTFALSVIGNVTSLLLFLSPVPTFYKIVKAKTIGDFSGVPYSVTLLNCALWVFYGLPFVTEHHLLVVTVNGVGFGLEVIYTALHLAYGNKQSRKKVSLLTLALTIIFVAFAAGVLLGTQSMDARKLVVGIGCLIVSIIMYASPLTIMRNVIKTKSTKYMPFFLSFTCFINGVVWALYGGLTLDIFITIPNGVGAILAFAQLILYALYYKRPSATKTIDDDVTKDQGQFREIPLA